MPFERDSVEIFQGVISSEKYQSGNPISRYLVRGFLSTVKELARKSGALDVHEVGCGEGQLSGLLAGAGFTVRGCDISENSLAVARAGAVKAKLDIPFKQASIYDLDPLADAAELVVCCEVLEHLENPRLALSVLTKLAKPNLIVSVPREPLWRMLNMLRGKYLGGFGNTPDHIQHWSTAGFVRLVSEYVEVLHVRQPVPWIVLLCRARG